MILLVCGTCRLAVRVLENTDEAAFLVGEKSQDWPKTRCGRCGQEAYAVQEIEADPLILATFRVIELTAKEAFAAANGLGFPEEHKCSLQSVIELLKEKPIRYVRGADVPGTERCFIDHFELWDGTKVYLGASPHGAVVYRVAPPFSYSKAVDCAR